MVRQGLARLLGEDESQDVEITEVQTDDCAFQDASRLHAEDDLGHVELEEDFAMLAGGGEIKKVEMRAMSLKELQKVVSVIRSRCLSHAWKDMLQRDRQLRPEEVNLYQLNFHHLCPAAAHDGILLR